MFQVDIATRATLEQVIQHPWCKLETANSNGISNIPINGSSNSGMIGTTLLATSTNTPSNSIEKTEPVKEIECTVVSTTAPQKEQQQSIPHNNNSHNGSTPNGESDYAPYSFHELNH